jgi:hypothetical protein
MPRWFAVGAFPGMLERVPATVGGAVALPRAAGPIGRAAAGAEERAEDRFGEQG